MSYSSDKKFLIKNAWKESGIHTKEDLKLKSKALEAKKERSIPSHKEFIFKKKSNGKSRAIPYRDSE